MLITYSVLILGYFTAASARGIQAFSISSSPFINTGNITPCYLDIAGSATNQINHDIQNQSNVHADHLKTQYADQFNQISQSMICRFQAKVMGITQLPAIVFNQKYVIYGMHNIQRAKLLFANYQDANA